MYAIRSYYEHGSNILLQFFGLVAYQVKPGVGMGIVHDGFWRIAKHIGQLQVEGFVAPGIAKNIV